MTEIPVSLPAASLPQRFAFRFAFFFLGSFFLPLPFNYLGPEALVEAYWVFGMR